MIPWFALFVWTLVLELPVYEYGAASRSRPWWHMPLVTLALNLLTHPAFTWWQLETHPSSGTVLQAEILIAVVEGLALLALRRELGLVRSLAVAFAANGFSYAVGVLVFALFF